MVRKGKSIGHWTLAMLSLHAVIFFLPCTNQYVYKSINKCVTINRCINLYVYTCIYYYYYYIYAYRNMESYRYISVYIFLARLRAKQECECEIVDWMDTYGSSPGMTLITAITAITATTHNMPIRIPKMSPKVKPSARRENGNKHKVPSCHQNANTQP